MAAFPEYFPTDDSLDLYIRDLADRVGLRDWKITLEDKAPEDGNLGECFCAYGQRVATIRLAEHDTIEKLRGTIIHELLHCHLDPIRFPLVNVKTLLGQPVYDVTYESFVDHLEYGCDAIAQVLAPLLPLPERSE